MIIVLTIKILLIVLCSMSIRATLPRYRYDQATQLNWSFFIFAWFLNFFFFLNFIYFAI